MTFFCSFLNWHSVAAFFTVSYGQELNRKNGTVSMNDQNLASLMKHDGESIKWDILMQKILSRMTKTFVVTTLDGRQLVYKLKLPEITFKVCRSCYCWSSLGSNDSESVYKARAGGGFIFLFTSLLPLQMGEPKET